VTAGRILAPGEVRSLTAGDRASGDTGHRWKLSPTSLAIAITSLLGLGLRLWWFNRAGSLTGIVEYDDGPYVSSAILLTHGVLPYRDYIFVQPPGITLILSPVAMLARLGLISTAGVMAAGRILTALVSAAGVPVLGLLIRHRGVAAVTIGCGLLAVYTGSIQAAHTVLLEPWLALFCLLGALVVFDGDRLACGKRLAWGGLLFGVAGAVEAWAILPVLVVLALCVRQPRRAVRFAAGVAAGFLAPVLPFLVLASHRFYQGVITAQVGHRAHAIRVSPLYRFRDMSGLNWVYSWSGWATVAVAVSLAGLVIASMIVASLLTGRGPAALDWFVLAVTAGLILMFLSPSQFLYHFMGFLGPFLAASVALPLARCADGVRRWLPISEVNWTQGGLTMLAVPIIGGFAALQAAALTGLPGYLVPSPAIQRLVPPGACLLSDTAPPLVLTGRLISTEPGCVTLLDSMGADLDLSHGLKPDTGAARSQALEQMWWRAFRHAQFVLLKYSQNPRVAWTPALEAYFGRHFTAIFHQGTLHGSDSQYYTLYRRRSLSERPSARR
jgi:alpha-1,2-mannosyltransferase